MTGRRTEIVRTECFRLGKATRFAFVQSMYSVESSRSQKSLSSLSELKVGRCCRAFLLFAGFINSRRIQPAVWARQRSSTLPEQKCALDVFNSYTVDF